MGQFVDLSGKRFEKLTVISKIGNAKSGAAIWLCRCDCGKYAKVVTADLKNGHSKSCGCYSRSLLGKKNKKHNHYNIIDDYVEMETSDGQLFLVDLEDFDSVKDVCWSKNNHGYFRGWKDGKVILLHRFIMNCPDNMHVDHIGGSTTIFDNRKSNLRIVSNQQNSFNHCVSKSNKSGVTGVRFDKRRNKWIATIMQNGKSIYLGQYCNIEDAISARKAAEIKYFGEYRRKTDSMAKKEVAEQDARRPTATKHTAMSGSNGYIAYTCGVCGKHVGRDDSFCGACGAYFGE